MKLSVPARCALNHRLRTTEDLDAHTRCLLEALWAKGLDPSRQRWEDAHLADQLDRSDA